MCLAVLEALVNQGKPCKQGEASPDLVFAASGLYHLPSAPSLPDCGTRRQA